MNSHLLPEFVALYRALPGEVRDQARQAYSLFDQNPHHPSLRFRQMHPTRAIFSARVGLNYRAVGVRQGDDIGWFWIGSHAEYDHLLRQL
jgi:hypothetical protein